MGLHSLGKIDSNKIQIVKGATKTRRGNVIVKQEVAETLDESSRRASWRQ